MRLALLAVAAVGVAACTAEAPTRSPGPATSSPPPTSLQALLDAEMASIPARGGIWVKHLTTGEEAGVQADDVFNSASVIKIPVAVKALEMAGA